MAWFSVSCFFERRFAEPDQESLYQESIFLVQADTPEQAITKASSCAQKEVMSYENIDGEPVRWEFVSAPTAYEMLEEPGSGAEVFSRFLSQRSYSTLNAEN